MQVIFASTSATFTTSYLSILLLRDNVQHHLQAGQRTAGYALLHAIAEPPLPRTIAPSAPQLWEEFSFAFEGIARLAVDQVAMSIRTRALMTGALSLPPIYGTVLARAADWDLPIATDGRLTIADLFSDIRDGIGRVTAFGGERGPIEVMKR